MQENQTLHIFALIKFIMRINVNASQNSTAYKIQRESALCTINGMINVYVSIACFIQPY